jgi:hypothetical protein
MKQHKKTKEKHKQHFLSPFYHLWTVLKRPVVRQKRPVVFGQSRNSNFDVKSDRSSGKSDRSFLGRFVFSVFQFRPLSSVLPITFQPYVQNSRSLYGWIQHRKCKNTTRTKSPKQLRKQTKFSDKDTKRVKHATHTHIGGVFWFGSSDLFLLHESKWTLKLNENGRDELSKSGIKM